MLGYIRRHVCESMFFSGVFEQYFVDCARERPFLTTAVTAALATIAAAAAEARRRRRSVSAGRGPVHQIRPGQSVAIYVVIRLFAVTVRQLGYTVCGHFLLVAHLLF